MGSDKKPSCCAECARYFRDETTPGTGFCDEWPVRLTDKSVCHPNIGYLKEEEDGEAKEDGGPNAVASHP